MNLASAVIAITVGSWVVVPGGSWSPSSEQRNEVRNQLESFVKVQADEQRIKLPNWSTYTFQYQGQLDEGKKVIFVNGFCISPPEYTRQQFVVVFDGGSCFFQVKYDPQKKKFFQLTFNGVA